MQVLLSGADPGELVALRDALNAALLRAMGRPLKPLDPNVLALQARPCPCRAIAGSCIWVLALCRSRVPRPAANPASI